MDLRELFLEKAGKVDVCLDELLPKAGQGSKEDVLYEAMRYSVFAGGKRLRPALFLAILELFGMDSKPCLPFACGLEMIHTYSLIHDDMPCMDNDDDRRGRATNHIIFGEATALLAGSALLSAAFETMLQPPATIPSEQALHAGFIIARASGLHGIAGGQDLDLHHSGSLDEAVIHALKTASLFIAAAEAGCVIAGAPRDLQDKAALFGKTFGLGFQFADDYEDGTGGERSRKSALLRYGEALDILQAFDEPSFLTTITRRMMDKLEEGGG